MIAGHAHPKVISAVKESVGRGLGFGAPTEIETTMAETLCRYLPSIERVRMVSSGTEAVMSAIRLARGFTQRDKILKFEGCYHGHADSLLIKAGSGALTLGVPSSPGVPAALAQHTLTVTYNALEQVQEVFANGGEDIAAVIVEPVAGNMNCVLPAPGFLEGLRALCDHYKSLLIFDEVMSGFRVALSGAQGYFNVRPDVTTLGKVIGGGLPVGFRRTRGDHGSARTERTDLTRPGRSREIPWRWPRGSRPWRSYRNLVSSTHSARRPPTLPVNSGAAQPRQACR